MWSSSSGLAVRREQIGGGFAAVRTDHWRNAHGAVGYVGAFCRSSISLTSSALIASLASAPVRSTEREQAECDRYQQGRCCGANRPRPSCREEKSRAPSPQWVSRGRVATVRCAQPDGGCNGSPAFDEAPAGEVEYADGHALALALACLMISYIAPSVRTERKSMLQAPPPNAASCKNPPAIARFLRKWTTWLGSAKLS
jgi:hypothetical protein